MRPVSGVATVGIVARSGGRNGAMATAFVRTSALVLLLAALALAGCVCPQPQACLVCPPPLPAAGSPGAGVYTGVPQ